MGFFGIGAPEMVIILVVALIIFGPGRLPEVAGQAGKAVRDFRRMTSELTGEFEKTVNEAGAGDLKASLTGELTGMKSQVDSVSKSVQRDLNKAATTVSSTASGTAAKTTAKAAAPKTAKPAAVKTGVQSGSSSTTKPVMATKADPLADVSAMDDEPEETKSSATEQVPVAPRADLAANDAGRSVSTAEANVPAPKTGQDGQSFNGLDGSGNGATSEALARARQRRQVAGYGNRRRL